MVSVIVPTRNSARTLEACLSSIRAQQGVQVELIVVDNGSTDGTQGIATRAADVVVYKGPERSAQRNYGASLAKSQYLLFVDSDMVLEPQVLSDCIAKVGHARAPAVIVPEVSVGRGFWAACRALERTCYVGDDLVEAARFFPRKIFEEEGGFDESLTGPEDWDLTIRIAAGKSLPRTASTICHDEGTLRLGTVLAKKRYYGASAIRYWRKHGTAGARQANLVFRPAFIRNWRRLLAHPFLAAGIVSLKTLETGAVLWGAIPEVLGSRGARRPKDPSRSNG